MKTQYLLPAAFLVTVSSIHGQTNSFPAIDAELFYLLRKSPAHAVVLDGERVDVVNARYEPCAWKKEARYLRVITPVGRTYDVRVMNPDGQILMRGSYADACGQVPDGAFLYYDGAGILRADGRYFNGRKTGTWHRYDARGTALPDKEYDGLDWDGQQVKLGLASISPSQEDLAGE